MSFKVTFGNIVVQGVRSVAPSTTLPIDRVATTSGKQYQQRQISISGFFPVLRKATPDLGGALEKVKELEDDLRNEGSATLSIPGYGNVDDARLTAVSYDELANGPVISFALTFAADTKNVHRDKQIALSSTSYNLNFTTLPELSDSWELQDPTIAASSQSMTKNRTFQIRGTFGGANGDIPAFRDNLENVLTDTALLLTTERGAFSVTVLDYSFSSPPEIDQDSSLTYEMTFVLEENFSLENHNLSHSGGTFGDVTFDIVTGFNHSIEYQQVGGNYEVVGENISVNGIVEFSTFAAAEAYQAQFKSSVDSPKSITSTTGNSLTIVSTDYSEPSREGRDTSGNQKYNLSGSINAQLLFDKHNVVVSSDETLLGIMWDLINSKNYGGTLNVVGQKTSDTISVSGKTATIPTVLVGNFDGTYYLTNFSIDGRDTDGRYNINASGRTLDTFELLEQFITDTFNGTVLVNEVTSHQRSTTYRFKLGEYEQTSWSETMSGSIHLGSPTQDARDTVLPLIETATAATKQLSDFRITNVSVGAKEPVVIKGTKQTIFKQSITLSGTRNFTPDASSGGGGGVSIVEESTFEVQQISNRYNQITIPGGPLIFKKTGLNPGRVTKTNTRRRVGGDATDSIDAPPAPDEGGLSGLEIIDLGIKRSGSSTNKSAKRTWTILEGNVPTNLPSTYGT